MENRTHKIAVISTATGKYGDNEHIVKLFNWYKLTPAINLQDFDTVIIDLTNLDREAVDWNLFDSLLSMASAEAILRPGGRIIVLGDPRFDITLEDSSSAPFLFWTGANYSWYNSSGDTVEINEWAKKSIYMSYISKIKRWDYALRSLRKHDYLERNIPYKSLFSDGFKLVIESERFASNRHHAELALQIFWTVKTDSNRGEEKEVLRYGPIILLPELSIAQGEALELILRDICNVKVAIIEPEWTEEIVAPGQSTLDEAISSIEDKVANLTKQLEEKINQRAEVRKFLRLLYDSGTSLEDIVREAFRELGADVEDPIEGDNNEDGWLEYQLHESNLQGVLEVKSTTKRTIGNDGLRQLAEWKTRGIENRRTKYKGIMVASTMINDPPEKRTNPFGEKFIESAKLHEAAVISTVDIYYLFCLSKDGKLDVSAFWEDLFNTVGIFDVSKYILKTQPSTVNQS